MFFGFVILCLVTVPTALCQNIHEKMTVSQRAQIFQQNHHSLVPDYEVVQFQIPRRNKRHSALPRALNLDAFQHSIALYLTPLDGGALVTESTPVYTATGTRYGDVTLTEMPDFMKKLGLAVVDTSHSASLILSTDSKGQYTFDGFIGSKNLVVRSLPESISYNLDGNNLSNDSDISEESRTTRSAYHVVFKREENDSEEKRPLCALHDQSPRVQTQDHNSKIPPEIVYPEITIVVDYQLYTLHGSEMPSMVSYLVAFWQAVDLLYRDFSQPKIRLNIARIIIATNYYGTPYLENNSSRIFKESAMPAASVYFYNTLNNFPDDNSDLVIMMTSRSIVDSVGNDDIIGTAWNIGAACWKLDTVRKFYSLGMVKEHGRFTRIFTAAHELGHLFGAIHDGWNGCNGTAGYIMGTMKSVTKNAHDFSTCSVQMINNFFRNGGGKCMLNVPRAIDSRFVVRKPLPGILYGRDAQCRGLDYHSSCYYGESWKSPCDAIYCNTIPYNNNPLECYVLNGILPVDGAICGNYGICLHQQCVGESQ